MCNEPSYHALGAPLHFSKKAALIRSNWSVESKSSAPSLLEQSVFVMSIARRGEQKQCHMRSNEWRGRGFCSLVFRIHVHRGGDGGLQGEAAFICVRWVLTFRLEADESPLKSPQKHMWGMLGSPWPYLRACSCPASPICHAPHPHNTGTRHACRSSPASNSPLAKHHQAWSTPRREEEHQCSHHSSYPFSYFFSC